MFKSKSNLLISFLFSLLIISVVMNVYFISINNSNKNENAILIKNNMERHQGFYLLSISRAEKNNETIFEYFQNPINLFLFIDGLKESAFYYRAATQSLSPEENKPYKAISLIEQYINELINYRNLIFQQSTSEFEYDINKIIHDIKIIGSWLENKNQKQLLNVYTDKEFYDEVYSKLLSKVKQFSFYEN